MRKIRPAPEDARSKIRAACCQRRCVGKLFAIRAHVHRVLVVDDDPRIREGVRVALEEQGCQVWCASNGQEALDVLRDGAEPCLILLDMNMPVLDGWDFLERWKHEGYEEIPVVVVSAVSEDELTIKPTETLSKTVAFREIPRLADEYCGCGDGERAEGP